MRDAQDAATLMARESMEVPEWSRFLPRAATSRGWRVDPRLAISRGPCASRHFSCLPICPETTFSAEEFRTLLVVRWQLLLHMDARFWKCGELLDVCGHQRSACSRIGLLQPRGTPAEVCMARICREAGARVKENQLLHDLHEGRGVARDRRQGQAIHEAEQDKRPRYSKLLTGTRCHFLVMVFEAVEVELWLHHVLEEFGLVLSLSMPRVINLLFFQRWTALLACSVQQVHAASLLGKLLGACACVNGPAVHVCDLDRLPCA